MSWVGLRYKGIEPLFPEEWNAVIDALDWLYAYLVDVGTKMLSKEVLESVDVDIIPAEDRRYDLGAHDRRWEQVHGYFGYFDGDLFVQGRRVIKDEDPIYIADFIDDARTDVDLVKSYLSQTAVNTAATASNTGDIKSQVARIEGQLGVIKDKVESIESTTTSIDTTTKSIEGKVDAIVASLSEIDAKLADVRSYTRSLLDTYAKVTEISGKLDEANARLGETVVLLSEIDAETGIIEAYARELPPIRSKTESIDAKLDTTNAKLSDIDTTTKSIDDKLGATLSSLSEIDSKLTSIRDYVKYVADEVASTESKTASIEVHVSSIDAKLDTTNTKLGNIESKVNSIDSKFDTQLSTRASEATLKKCCALDYDFAIRRSGGKLLATIDFTVNEANFGINEFDLGLVKVEGNVVSKSIVSWASEGIPQPEGTGSPYVLRVTVAPRGLVYVRVPIRARYWKPFSAYVTLYAKNRDVRVVPYVTLGGILSGFRNKLPKRLRLPADRWGRFMVHWFMEAHHGCAELVIEVENPWDEQVDVYVGVITAGEVEPYVKGHMMVFGWEDTFELELNNEIVDFVTAVMLPTNAGEVASLTVEYGIAGDGSNPLSITVDLLWGGVTIISDSNSSTTPKYSFFDFKVVNAKRGPYGFEYMPFRVWLSTSGSGKLVKFAIVLKAFAREYRYQRYVETMVPGGSLVTLIDYSGDVKHIVGGRVEASAPSDGDVNILADTPEGEVVVAKIPAGSMRTIDINGRYTYLKVQNTGSGTATVRATLMISDSYLPR